MMSQNLTFCSDLPQENTPNTPKTLPKMIVEPLTPLHKHSVRVSDQRLQRVPCCPNTKNTLKSCWLQHKPADRKFPIPTSHTGPLITHYYKPLPSHPFNTTNPSRELSMGAMGESSSYPPPPLPTTPPTPHTHTHTHHTVGECAIAKALLDPWPRLRGCERGLGRGMGDFGIWGLGTFAGGIEANRRSTTSAAEGLAAEFFDRQASMSSSIAFGHCSGISKPCSLPLCTASWEQISHRTTPKL